MYRSFRFLPFLVTVACLATQEVAATSSYSAQEILFKVFDQTGGLSWASSKDWLSDEICTYEGVACYDDDEPDVRREGHVQSIDLSGHDLSGRLPSELYSLPYLQKLDLSGNPQLVVEFQGIADAQYLEYLDISQTSTMLISGIEALVDSLKELYMSDLIIDGPIPDSIYKLVNLEVLVANTNAFTGPIATDVGNFFAIRVLALSDNDLESSLPTQIGNLVNLQTLDLSNNRLSGNLPSDAIDNLTDLRSLDLSQDDTSTSNMNGLTGSLPNLANMQNLISVDLRNQRIGGAIPENFLQSAPTNRPIRVDLTNNLLTGGIPTGLLEKSRLDLLLANNRIDTIDSSICSQVPGWLGGDVATSGNCDGFLCPRQFYSPDEGRQTRDQVCLPCPSSQYFGATTCDTTPDGSKNQHSILVSFFNAVGGRYWKDKTNWLSLDSDYCTWKGISCNGDVVTGIRLPNNDLSGTIPKSLFDLPSLRTLDLSYNSIVFSFEGIGNAENLENLDLTQTDLSDMAGIEKLSFTNIHSIYLASNNLSGAVPSSIFNLLGLQELDISHNSFSGLFPSEVGQLLGLQKLYIYGNAFSGQFPTQIGNLMSLVELKASENDFSGILPTQISQLSDLEHLSFRQLTSSSSIGGTLPSFENLKKLVSVHLDGNALFGSLPSNFLENSIRGSSASIEIKLANNAFSGEIPSSWASRFDNLLIDLTGNQLTAFGAGICNKDEWMNGLVETYGCDAILCRLGTFNEYGRQLGGDSSCRVCDEVSVLGSKVCGSNTAYPLGSQVAILGAFFHSTHGENWKESTGWIADENLCTWYGVDCDPSGNVIAIELPSNGLSGSPTSDLWKLPKLRKINLRQNEISFDFQGIGDSSDLVDLDLSSTQLNSVDGLQDATGLVELRLDDNDLSGSFPSEILMLHSLRYLSLNFNQIEGRLPSALTDLTMLSELFLLNNRLEGQIPAKLGTLSSLKILDLSGNNFDSTIPPEMNDLARLEVLSISNGGGMKDPTGASTADIGRGIYGLLPAFDQLTSLRQLSLGYNSLSGTIPPNFLSGIQDKDTPIEVDLTSNRLGGGLPASLARFESLTLHVTRNRLWQEIPTGICRQSGWMRGKVASFGCNAILCPPGTYNSLGRQESSSSVCETCEEGKSTEYFGSIACRNSLEQNNEDERQVLEELFHATDGERWVNHYGWLDPRISVCDWYGIGCNSNGDSVESIQLSQNGLDGIIPQSIYDLSNLVEVDISFNDAIMGFTGISKAEKLEYLNLDNTGLESVVGIEDAPSLMLLHLEDNSFGGSFPFQVLQMPSLQVLYLSHNDIGNELPSSISQLQQIAGFACQNCGLAGPVPAAIGEWTLLEYLDLSDNLLSGALPTSINMLSRLRYVNLSNQKQGSNIGLSGNLPSFANAAEIREVYLDRNSFQGPIPADFLELADSSDTFKIDLSFNILTGQIPGDLTRIKHAKFYASGNQITEVPSDLCSNAWNDHPGTGSHCNFILCGSGTFNGIGRATESLGCETCASLPYAGSTYCVEGEREALMDMYHSLGGNNWVHNDGWGSEDPVCSWFGITCHEDHFAGTVARLDLSNNQLEGTLPDNIWLLTEMDELILSNNNIIIPSFQMGAEAASLHTLKLSNNQVQTLDGIEKMTYLKDFHCTNCHLEGPFPPNLILLEELELLFLDYNEMTGPLPQSINYMHRLRELHLTHNRFDGQLPYQLGYLFWIENLSLGFNKFTGSIPSQLGSLPFLRILALDSEQQEDTPKFGVIESGLSGNLPSFARAKRLKELYLGHNSVGGTIPMDFLSGVLDKSAKITVDLTKNMIRHTVPASLVTFDDLRLFVAGNRIEIVPQQICSQKQWMEGLMMDDCDAFLCPPGTYNDFGRRTSSEQCQVCDYRGSATYYGATQCVAIVPDLKSDRSKLLELYHATGGDEWIVNDGWGSQMSICTWYGIKCDLNSALERVSEISLPINNLKGRLAPMVFHLPSLRKLDLSGNREVSVSFIDIENSQSLEEVNLEYTRTNNLEGLERAVNLRTLRLSNNAFFERHFPDEILALRELRVLQISNSGLTGDLPEELGQFAKLEVLDASGNELHGTIPNIFSGMTNLEVLDLSNNRLFGSIPSSIGALSSLRVLDLNSRLFLQTGLSGPLPSFSGMSHLSYLDIAANSITGTVPSDFLASLANPSGDLVVNLQGNVIHGNLPSSLSMFPRLNLTIADNEIESIDKSLCSMTNWWGGQVSGCDGILCRAGHFNDEGRQTSPSDPCILCPGDNSGFLGSTACPSLAKAEAKKILQSLYHATGGGQWKSSEGWFTNPDICQWYGVTCKDNDYVEQINLGSNNLVNTPPKEIFAIIGLKHLWLYSNPIEFSFEGIEEAKTLQNLQLDSTRLKSLAGVGNAPVLKYLDVRFNGMEGTFPEEIQNLSFLETLLISENNFNSPLPHFLENRKLQILRASNNAFQGVLPSFSLHPDLKTVDVANNQLTGELPTDLFPLVDPSMPLLLDISGNRLSGMLPANLGRFSYLTLYAKDNQITGIEADLCSQSTWNDGSVGIYGCDAILCPPQTYSSSGRASNENGGCEPCPHASFFGHSACGKSAGSSRSSNLRWLCGIAMSATVMLFQLDLL